MNVYLSLSTSGKYGIIGIPHLGIFTVVGSKDEALSSLHVLFLHGYIPEEYVESLENKIIESTLPDSKPHVDSLFNLSLHRN